MHSNLWLSILEPIELVSLALALGSLIRMRLTSKWPFLVAALAVELVSDLTLIWFLHHPGHYNEYLYTYWISLAVQAILRLGLTADMIRSLPGTEILPRSLYLFIGVAGATMAAASAFYCFESSPHTLHALTSDLIDTAILINRCVNVAWGTFLVALLASIKKLGPGWTRLGAGLSAGIIMRICSATVVGELLAKHSWHIRLFANGLDSFCSIAVFLFWAARLLPTPQPPAPELSPVPYAVSLSLEKILSAIPQRES